jgi:hypothetical protein
VVRFLAARESAPLALRMRQRALTAPRDRRSLAPRRLGLGLAGALATLVSVLAFAGGGQARPTVALAATLATRPAVATVADPPDDSVRLPGLRAAGLPFPYWEDRFGWHAIGARTDRLDGRAATTVFYRRGAEHIAYTIVSGKPLAAGATVRTLATGRTDIRTVSTAGGQRVVTWLRRGHTCLLSGRDVPLHVLDELASWRGHGQIPY